MRNGLQMETGPRFLKPALLGAVVVAFGAVTYTMMSGNDDKPKALVTAAADVTTDQTAATEATPATPAAPDQMAQAAAPTGASSGAADTSAAATAPAATEAAASAQPKSSPDKLAAADSSAVATQATAAPKSASTASAKSSGVADTSADSSSMSAAIPQPAAETSEVADAAPAEKPRAAKPKLVRSSPLPAAEALRAWWATPESPQRLGVEYVGQAADQKSLVIRFDQQVTDPAATQNIKLVSFTGQPVAAAWQAGEDPRVLVAPNLEPGRYTVLIGPELASIQGQSLGTELHGPAFIQ